MEKKNLIKNVINFIKINILKVLIIIVAFQLISSLKSLPYLNLIGNFYSFAFLITAIIAYFLFLQYLNAKRLIVSALNLLVVVIPFLLIRSEEISNFLGFVIYAFLLGAVIIAVFKEKKDLRV